MKTHLPYNILLAVTIAVTGFVALYNFLLRESYATTLQYSYPVIEQAQPEAMALPEPERIEVETDAPEEVPEAVQEAEPEEDIVTRVQFPLDINTATVEQLKFIPQVGDVMSQRIVQYREVLGGYTDLEQLKEIKGVGDKTYERLYAYFIIREEDSSPEDGEQEAEEQADEQEDPQEDEKEDDGNVVNRQNLYVPTPEEPDEEF